MLMRTLWVLSFCLALAACKETVPTVESVRPAQVWTVTENAAPAVQTYAGELRARYEADLAFRVGGKVVERRVELGQRVQAGEVLARLDAVDLELGVTAARAELAGAEADLLKAQQELAARCNQPKNGPAVQVKFVDAGKPVKRLAVISGAGGSLFADAIAMGADCLLTGEANHHHAIDAKRLGLSLIAAGHYATEFPVTAAVAAKLRAALPELEVLVSTENRDPYTYL